MKHLRLFENFDRQELNEGAIKNLITMIDSIDGDADLDPVTQWTPEEAIEWGVGFEKEYGLWHPDEIAQDVIWDDNNKPRNLVKADKQMENFSNVDWKGSKLGADLDQYVMVKVIKDAISAGSMHEAKIKNGLNEQLFIVVNQTDGTPASPEVMSDAEADKFIHEFTKRFKAQGYYLTNKRERINPLDVRLEKVPVDDKDVYGEYEAVENITMRGFIGDFKVKRGDTITIDEGKMPKKYKVKLPNGGITEISTSVIQDLVAAGRLEFTGDLEEHVKIKKNKCDT